MIYFITGGSRGVGANLVEQAAKLGHHVAFTYNHNEQSARELIDSVRDIAPDARVRCYQLDVRDSKQVESVIDQVVDDFETIEVVVNNAGVNRDNVVVSMSDEEWHEVIDTNLNGTFYVCRGVITTLLANRWGRIINISSIVANGATGQANYAASKAGIHGLTQAIAKEYGRKGITANVVVPGFFDTDMTRATMPEAVQQFWKAHAKVPKGRIGQLPELSALVNFLASRDASFINGQVIRVSGGVDWAP